jgi:hypothetical protein
MGIEVETRMIEHQAKEFWGGDDKGVCIQITASAPLSGSDQQEGFIQLTMEEASALCETLGRFILEEAKRRQNLLKGEIARLKITERTIFHEVAELSGSLLQVPDLAVEIISRFCPRAPKEG